MAANGIRTRAYTNQRRTLNRGRGNGPNVNLLSLGNHKEQANK